MPMGTIKMFNTQKRFGFIIRDDGQPDAFFHVSALAGSAEEIAPGTPVEFEIGVDEKTGRMKAIEVTERR